MKVFYSGKMVADAGSYSPSAIKPHHVALAMKQENMPIDFVAPEPASLEQLKRSHDPDFIQGVLSGQIPNGFGNNSVSVRASLPYTNGSMIDAAKASLVDGAACSLSSGFHHAGYSRAEGFCTFNGLMVAVFAILDAGLAKRIAIVDCDQHYGDGTDDILAKVGAPGLLHISFGLYFSRPDQGPQYLAKLRGLKKDFLEHGTQLIIYQAGADAHVDDPLGGVLTTAQMRQRDRIMFATARELGIPIAWNLAGGYQRDDDGGIGPVVGLHLNTMRECLATFAGVNGK